MIGLILAGIAASSPLVTGGFVISRSPVQVGSPAPVFSTTYGEHAVFVSAGPSGTAAETGPIDRAAALLGDADLPTVALVAHRPTFVSAAAEAFTIHGRPIIYILTDTPLWALALRGDQVGLIRLAAVLAHEAVHVRRGDLEERPAFEAELRTLKRLNAPTAIWLGKYRAMLERTR